MNAEREIRKAAELRRQTQVLVAGFLKVEVGVSLTFAEAALNAGGDSQKCMRNRAAARKGYDTIHRYLKKYTLPLDDNFRNELDHLKAALQGLGETGLED